LERDDATGFYVAPARYSAHGRETIDRMRDATPALYSFALSRGASVADAVFYVHCILDAMKYEDREGKKGDPLEDMTKARWYRQMAAHAVGDAHDPRENRGAAFVPYVRQ
jgi:hypothetical protein